MESLICKFTIPGRLDGLNEYTKANRGNKYQGNSTKRKNQERIFWAIREAKLRIIDKYPVKLKITWYEPNLRRDVDNITMGVKFILDELVRESILIDDSQKFVKGIYHTVKVDKENPRIEVVIERIQDER